MEADTQKTSDEGKIEGAEDMSCILADIHIDSLHSKELLCQRATHTHTHPHPGVIHAAAPGVPAMLRLAVPTEMKPGGGGAAAAVIGSVQCSSDATLIMFRCRLIRRTAPNCCNAAFQPGEHHF